MKKVRFTIVFIIVFIASNGVKLYAQTDPLIDSLKTLLINPKNDSLAAVYNNSLLKLYAPIQQDSAMMFGERAKAIALKLNNAYLIASNVLNFGSIYWYQSDFTKAMDHFTRAAAMYDSLGYENDLATARSNIGLVYMLYGELSKAEPYFKEAYAIHKKYNDERGIAQSMYYMGFILHSNKKYDSAIIIIESALKVFEKTKNLSGQARATSGLGECYKELGNFAKARDYLLRSMQLEEMQGNTTGVTRSLIELGSLEKAMGNYSRAEQYFEDVEKREELKDNFTERVALYNEWTDMYVKMGDYKLAFENEKKLLIAYDSFRVRENRAKLDEINEKYETAQKEAKIVSLEEQKQIQELEIAQQRNQNLLLLFAASFLFIIAFFITILLIQFRKRKKEVESRNKTITKINKALNKSQDELLLSNKTKDKFFALIAHDLRGPVTSLQGIGRMLEYYNSKGDENRINQLISQVDQSAQSVNHLLDNLLKWALSQTNGLAYHPTVFALGRIMDECTIIFEENLKAKQIGLVKDIHENTIVEADYYMISTVLRNILSNALKFSPVGGTITIATTLLDEQLEINITDTGNGIPEETLAALRQKQAVSSTQGTQNERGTGLGLTLCQEFVSRHGADLDISSSSEGTRIAFTLKTVAEAALV